MSTDETTELNGVLRGTRILIVEDEFLVGLTLEEDFKAAGATVIGPYRTLAQTVEAMRKETFDVAILDVNLGRELVYPVADRLVGLNIPFLFLTGYNAGDIPAQYRIFPRLSKPYDVRQLLAKLRDILKV